MRIRLIWHEAVREKHAEARAADAVRNRERVARGGKKAVFQVLAARRPASRPSARSAGVGIGHALPAFSFPLAKALFRKRLYRREVQHLADLAEQLKQEAQPVDALRHWDALET